MTLEVLEYVADHPKLSRKQALATLKVSLHTWYDALARLESLNLVALEHFPGTRTLRTAEVTAHGRAALHLAKGLRAAVEGSRGALELELKESPPRPGSPAAGELLLKLIEFAERHADYAAMKALEKQAAGLGRPGEAAFAAGLSRFLQGDRRGSLSLFAEAASELASDKGGRSYRRATFFHAAALDSTGDHRRAYVMLTDLRRAAQDAHDDATESDARLGIAILKAVRNQWGDSFKQLEGALACAKRTGSPARQAKVLTSLCLVDFMLNHHDGLPRSEEALSMARRSGSKLMTMHIRANRSLMFAWQGDRKGAAREIREARRMSKEAGYEPGLHVLEGWAALSRRIAAHPPKAYPLDLRGQVSALLRSPPTQSPEADTD